MGLVAPPLSSRLYPGKVNSLALLHAHDSNDPLHVPPDNSASASFNGTVGAADSIATIAGIGG